jgi:hypothetical protein
MAMLFNLRYSIHSRTFLVIALKSVYMFIDVFVANICPQFLNFKVVVTEQIDEHKNLVMFGFQYNSRFLVVQKKAYKSLSVADILALTDRLVTADVEQLFSPIYLESHKQSSFMMCSPLKTSSNMGYVCVHEKDTLNNYM